jgi:hypothetical protein
MPQNDDLGKALDDNSLGPTPAEAARRGEGELDRDRGVSHAGQTRRDSSDALT